MSEPLAYFNGQQLPVSQLMLPVYDMGFVQGVAVSEQMRTFRGELFRPDEHLKRLSRSLEIVGLDDQVDLESIFSAAQELVRQNHPQLKEGQDLGLSLFVTPGPYPTMAPSCTSTPTIGMHTFPLPFHLWADCYQSGQDLLVSPIRQVPAECWPPELKCRSRMHYYLADREAALRQARARAILLDSNDRVIEASTANIIAYRHEEGLISPPREMILPGVSVAVVEELAATLQIPFVHREVTVSDILTADEVLLTSTSPCVWPVLQVDRQKIGNGVPGEIFVALLQAWSDLVGVDIRGQAERWGS